MKRCGSLGLLVMVVSFTFLEPGLAETRYVSLCGGHVPPFTNWIDAATNIQAAIDVASEGDTVLVTNGVYDSGGVPALGSIFNRIAVTNAVRVCSVNGARFTVIRGQAAPGGGCGSGAVRCAYVANGSMLSGFTLTNGYTGTSASHYDRPQCSGGGVLCESTNDIVSECVISGNQACWFGGGCSRGLIDHCQIFSNYAIYGGGVEGNIAQNSLIYGNTAAVGGGASGAELLNCTIVGNSANWGGGFYYCSLINCILYFNMADDYPNWYPSIEGAVSMMVSCCTTPTPPWEGNITNDPQFVSALAGNHHLQSGSPCIDAGTNQAWMASADDLEGNSRIVGNAVDIGCYEMPSVAPQKTLILWNKLGSEYEVTHSEIGPNGNIVGMINYLPAHDGNGFKPQEKLNPGYYDNPTNYIDFQNLQLSQRGSIEFWYQADWVRPTDGCRDVMWYGVEGKPYSICIQYNDWQNLCGVAAWNQDQTEGIGIRFIPESTPQWTTARPMHFKLVWDGTSARAEDRLKFYIDGVQVGDYYFGDYTFDDWAPNSRLRLGSRLMIWNWGYHAWIGGGGIFDDLKVYSYLAVVHYVSLAGGHVPPFTNWVDAATNIQVAIDVANAGEIVLVTNGIYNSGGRTAGGQPLPNRITITNAIMVRSVNGPQVTVIEGMGPVGDAAVRCAYVGGNAMLAGFTLTDGHTRDSGTPDAVNGGAVWCQSANSAVSNCLLVGNVASGNGGGAYGGRLVNCIVSSNSAMCGGGACDSALSECRFETNSAVSGGGAFDCRAENTVLSGNRAGNGGGVSGGTLFNCTVVGNMASNVAGGVEAAVMLNCISYFNTAPACTNYNDNENILWNKLGSDSEVMNSEMGPNGQIVGAVNFLPAHDGSGFQPQPRTGDHNIPNNYVQFDNLQFFTCGSIEFWYWPNWKYTANCVDVLFYGETNRPLLRMQYNDWQDVFWVGAYNANFSDSIGIRFTPRNTSAWTTNRPMLFKIAWDGTATNIMDRLQFLIDGAPVGATSFSGSPTFGDWPANSHLRIGSRFESGDWDRHPWEGGCGIYDDLKISGYAISFTCTTPLPLGYGNITNEPQFVDATNRDYRLLPSSSCLDAGINQDWMLDATDLEGNPRILNGTVDMGAYEFAVFEGSFRVWLQGPYNTNTHVMTRALNAAGRIPRTSPYADDPRRVLMIPANATDWVLLQLRKSTNSTPLVSKSVFLGERGDLLTDGGETNLMLEASAGSYYLAIKHRNHLAVMSANPVPFTNQFVSYDFTPDADRYYGGANGTVELESNVWGMIAGDADGDGEILEVDALIYDTQTNTIGYRRADFNLDGVISNEDRDILWSNNLGRCAAVAQGETILKPALKIRPARKTLVAESTNIFSASGGTGTIAWAFVKNPSRGSITATYPTSIVYQAGTVSSNIDVLEAWDREDRLGRAYVNVINSNEMVKAGKAIIVAGRKSKSDSVWPITDYLADLAYNTLLYRGYGKQHIHYLNPVTNQDVDGNGQTSDDIDLETTLANTASTFTNLAATRPDRLFVYLVDHGGDSSGAGYFRLNETEILTATNLDAWLDDLQNAYTTTVTVLIDCCYAGSFLDELVYTGKAQRIVIAACGTNEPTYFLAGGLVSFSDAFFGGVMRGDDVEHAWLAASNAMIDYQNACWNNKETIARSLCLGASFVAGKDIPQIGRVIGNQLLTRTTVATLWAGDVVSFYPIERVWCLVAPPGHRPDPEDPVTDLVKLDLPYDNQSGRYQARYEGFSENGRYHIRFYAEDIWGSVSPPRQSFVQQSDYDERVILMAGGPTNSANWDQIDGLARHAYHTFLSRWLDHGRIYYLSAVTNQYVNGDETNDVDALVSSANLAYAITNWADSADTLTLYVLGEGTNETLRLNETEYLDAESLNGWLNAFLVSNELAKVNVVMDFSGSGGFLPGLAASNWVCIASCRSNQPAIWAREGVVSFSRYFLGGLFEGDNLYQAYSKAERATRRATSPIRQKALLDDNGDQISNKRDGLLARQRYIGAAFMTGADAPTIGSVTPDTVLTNTSSLALWASGVTDMDGISNVWCVVTWPNWTNNLERVDLAWTNTHYEALYTNFSIGGVYVLTFQAMDSNGVISAPVQTQVRTEMIDPDAYEPDNTYGEARFFAWNQTQTNHTFHCSNDEDWVYFYAVSNFIYEIETIQRGENVDTVLDVYYELADGTLTNITPEEDWDVMPEGPDDGEITWLEYPTPGRYYVRVSSGDPTAWGTSSEYELTIKIPTGGNSLWVLAVDVVHPSFPFGAIAIVDGMTEYFDTNMVHCFNGQQFSASSTHTVEVVVAAGYRMVEDPNSPNQISNLFNPDYGNPRIVTMADSNACYNFYFYPYVQVETGSVICDRWTHKPLSDVKLIFHPTSGRSTDDCEGDPWYATWKSNWHSQADGTFPANVFLPTVKYDLILTRTNYCNGVFTNVIVDPPPGQVTNLGMLELTSLKVDSWVKKFFGSGANVAPNEDPDGDGHNNYVEYRLGTDPTNRDSVLKVQISMQSTSGITLSWPVADDCTDCTYKIQTSDRLTSDIWTQQVMDSSKATYGQPQMQCVVTNPVNQIRGFYRLNVHVP